MLQQSIAKSFQERFDHSPLLIRAPGRVNLIGEHTDYNEGFVLPGAIDKEIHFAVGLNGTGKARFYAFDLEEEYETEIAEVKKGKTMWANYLKGVVAQFQKRGFTVPGFDCVFGGTIPIGAGLSSSAAVECGLAFALNNLLSTGLDRMTLATWDNRPSTSLPACSRASWTSLPACLVGPVRWCASIVAHLSMNTSPSTPKPAGSCFAIPV